MPDPTLTPSERLIGWALNSHTRDVAALLAAVGMAWGLLAHRYPWWLWVPAVFLTFLVTGILWYVVSYLYQKSTYPERARQAKLRRQQGRGE